MQIKTIQKNLVQKMEQWLESITDLELKKDVRKNLLVSGGSIASMLLNEPVNDYDVYLKDVNVLKKLTLYYIKNIDDIILLDGREKAQLIKAYNGSDTPDICGNDSYAVALRTLKDNQIKLYFQGAQAGYKTGVKQAEKPAYLPVYFSPNAISLTDNLQIVLRFWGDAKQIHETFDYIHATNYFTFEEGLVRNLAAMESILTKQLKYQGSHYPVTSIIRAKKFVKRGFNIGAGEMMKIMFQISQLDLTNIDTLEEQLIGVDVAYFDVLITALRNKFVKEPKFQLSQNYFNSLIDRIFGEEL